VLLHGDLHHWNVLRAQREPWLVIDPHGVIGEPAYETGALLRNPNDRLLDLPDPPRTLSRRVDILSERLGFDRQRIIGWAMAQAVLSAIWSVEDREPAREFAVAIAVADIFASMT
jgi:streptomycin 6-kinase